jgi:tryptophanyl-tRNA synthetase
MDIVSGMRPTGKLHLGHYFGALHNWKAFQAQKKCLFFVADWHALTTHYQDSSLLSHHTLEMVADWLAVGIDPDKAVISLQSAVPAHAELYLILSMFTPLGWLERNPTYKEQKNEIKDKDINNLGFLGYPVLQAADVLIYQGEKVPVGKDQVPHLEMTREIARRFNHLTQTSIFPEPEALLTATPKINGIDGRKMSKSYNNAINLDDDAATLEKKIKSMQTDSKRVRRDDPGEPTDCNLFPLHTLYSDPETVNEVTHGCRTAKIGCMDCKKKLLPSMQAWLEPIRRQREKWMSQPKDLENILHEGSQKANQIATETLKQVRETLHVHPLS